MAGAPAQFAYGSYKHPVGEVGARGIKRVLELSQTGRPYMLREIWSMFAKIVSQGDGGPSAVQGTLAALRAVYSVNNQSFGFLDSSGSQTALWVNAANGLGTPSTIVTNQISNPRVAGAEGVGFLHYDFELQVEYLVAAQSDLLEYEETLTFDNNFGGPSQVIRKPVNAGIILQNITQASAYYATQTGHMRQAGSNPPAETPIFPGYFDGTKDNPYHVGFLPVKVLRGKPISYGTEWRYSFLSNQPFFGNNHAWG